MGENTKIEWAHHTFNPWVGCTKVSAACDHCYAEGWAKRTGSAELWSGERRRTSAANWKKPLKWAKDAKSGSRPRVFCASLADVFDNQVPEEWRSDLWSLILSCPHLDWLLLTKRPQNMRKMLPLDWGDGWPNVWLGVTAENQVEADRRVPILLNTPAAVRFVSYEPALGPVHFGYLGWPNDQGTARTGFNALLGYRYEDGRVVENLPRLDWIIAGGESGPGARPAHPDWFRSVRDQCAAAGVAFLFKQHGEWLPGEVYSKGDAGGFARHMDGTDGAHGGKPDHWWSGECFGGVISTRVGKKHAGRLIDGVEHNGFPA